MCSYSASVAPERTFFVREQQRLPAPASPQALRRVVEQPAPRGFDHSVLYTHVHTAVTSPQTGQRGLQALEGAAANAFPLSPAVLKLVGETLALQEPPRAHQRQEGRNSAATRQPSQVADQSTEIELLFNMDASEIAEQEEAFKKKVAISVAVAVRGIVSKVLPLHVKPGELTSPPRPAATITACLPLQDPLLPSMAPKGAHGRNQTHAGYGLCDTQLF